MFRNPRHQTTNSKEPVTPSVGRPPTPPSLRSGVTSSSIVATEKMAAVRQKSSSKTQTTLVNSFAKAQSKSKASTNGNILSFFKKVDQGEQSLFLDSVTAFKKSESHETVTTTLVQPEDWDDREISRYNENGSAVKRRRLESVTPHSRSDDTNHATDVLTLDKYGGRRERVENEVEKGRSHIPNKEDSPTTQYPKVSGGPFVEDSDSEDDTPSHRAVIAATSAAKTDVLNLEVEGLNETTLDPTSVEPPIIPSLKRETTSFAYNEIDEFERFEDLGDDEFPEEGEEYMERRWMEEQRQLELEFERGEDGIEGNTQAPGMEDTKFEDSVESPESSCPICGTSFQGISPEKASIHVNDCLDGKSGPLPDSDTVTTISSAPAGPTPKRFQRAAIARPGQPNPFASDGPSGGSSAFSRLMSSHAEDAAWAQAAANEVASRGKPAFKRTCPFYKILPGFSICVDAFRYGAVEGCEAYFLSHFHSDHYIGLTSSWCHGPIFCSRVTGNLARQQLRVVSKWVVDLDFEKKTEVPGTRGVFVTMIPANHCPGSSLFLFEKAVGKGNHPKTQRVLHCGDFRACPAHVQHPLLRPSVVDAVSGKQRQQKLDVCYLDTTYLTPKYAFPTQESVIKACADMCVSMSKEKVDETDDWEQTKKARAGSGMVKFVCNESHDGSEGVDDSANGVKSTKSKKGGRGRLLVIVGTYSIGKERICLGIARALNSKIFAPPAKQRICLALEDPELASRLTSDPLEAQVHMQMLMEIRAETLADYLTEYKPHFSRIVGFRPSGWNYRPPNSRFVESPLVQTVLHSDNWKPKYSMAELIPQRGSTREASCFGVPYSEHSSFRELTMFCCALRIDKIIPTVNIGSAKSREKMKGWIEKWGMEKKKNGLFAVADDGQSW